MLCVAGLSGTLLVFVGESNAEYPQTVAIGGFDINDSLNQGLPFLDHWPQFVCGQVHTMEVGEDIASLNIFCDQSEFSEWPFGIMVTLEVSKGYFKHTVLQALRSNFWKNILFN